MKIINVNRVKDIPNDYFSPIGVPLTYMLNPDPRFEILDIIYPVINGKNIFVRVVIVRKSNVIWKIKKINDTKKK